MNKKYIVFALALFACFGSIDKINAGENKFYKIEDGIYRKHENETTEGLINFINNDGDKTESLDLSWSEVIDFANSKINWAQCKKLKTLDLSHTKIKDSELQKIIKECPTLKKINLLNCVAIKGSDLVWTNCMNLKELRLDCTSISDTGLQKITKPEVLYLNYTKITDSGLQSILANCKNLKKLSLNGCKALIFNKDLDWKNCGALEELYLGETKITDGGLQGILTNCKNLKTLSLFACKALEFDKDLEWKNSGNLEKLRLWSTNITNKGLQKILTQCSKLKELSLTACGNLEFEKFEDFNWTLCKNLAKLDLVRTNITAAGLKNLLDGCTNLKELNLNSCKKLDEKYRQEYKTQKDIEQLKKDLGIENPKSLPTNPTQKPFWLVAKWQALPTHWKWAIGVGAVAIPVIGAFIFYKKTHTIQKLSSAIWRRLPSFLKRQKTVNQPLITQHLYKI